MQTFQEKISKELNVSADQVWKIIGSVDDVDKWFSSLISSCRVEDGKRYCMTADGIPLEEDIIDVNHKTKTFKYGIPTQTMLPANDIIAAMKVKDNGQKGAIVDWSAEFKATSENAPIVKEAFRKLWNMGLEEMENYINQK